MVRTCVRYGLAVLALAAQTACGGDEPASPVRPPADAATDAGPCAPGTVALEDGSCQPAGVAPEGCGEGFAPADIGCTAILPAEACADGTMAVPGETSCREVAPCAAGTWGDLALRADTQRVDQAYSGAGSDGSEAKPWTTVQEGVDAAADGAIVAVAAGTYAEDVAIQGKRLRLWGKCPGEVETRGSAGAEGAVGVGPGADGTEVSRIGVTGVSRGILVAGASDVVLDRVWVHDTASQGVAAQMTSFTLTGSLVERAHDLGVFVIGAEGVVEATVVRDTRPDPTKHFGRGVDVEYFVDTKTPGKLTLRGSVVEQAREYALYVSGSDAVVETTVLRDMLVQALDGTGGRGISVRAHTASGRRSSLQVGRSVVERVVDTGVYINGADATLDVVSVRDVASATDGRFGRGLEILPDPDLLDLPKVDVRWSVFERPHEIGVLCSGCELDVESSVVRDVLPGNTVLKGGRGINAQFEEQAGLQRAVLTVRGSVVERTSDVGIYVISTDATIEATVVRATAPDGDGSYGDGISLLTEVAGPASAIITGVLVAESARAGISAFGATVHLGQSQLDCNLFALDGEAVPAAFLFEDSGGNRCGCAADTAPCTILTSNLAPPTASQPSAP